MTLEEAFKLGLPKWPQCVIYGKSVTEKQALEIIRRTDNFYRYPFGNNHCYVDEAVKILRLPNSDEFKLENGRTDWEAYDVALADWKEKWQLVETEYVKNDWISCSWIGGPNGWCHPDGKIGNCHNIGKWPEVEDVYKDLCTIAKAFPFLELVCLLTDREESESGANVVVTFEVKGGKVHLIENVSLSDALDKCNEESVEKKFNPYSLFNPGRENYFSLDQLYIWADEVFNKH